MTERKRALIVTSSTASVRGNEGQLSHSAAMGGKDYFVNHYMQSFRRKVFT